MDEHIYFSKIMFTEGYIYDKPRSVILLDLPQRELSYQVFSWKHNNPVIQGLKKDELMAKLSGKEWIESHSSPAKIIKNDKTNFQATLVEDYCLGTLIEFNYGIRLSQSQYEALLPYCNALDFEPYRNKEMSMKDEGFAGYRDEITVSFAAVTDSYIPYLKLPMNYYYDEEHIWPSEKLYRYIYKTFLNNDIDSANSLLDYLCSRYDTKIFRDLYHDHQESNGLLLPLTIEDAGKYHSKQELFEKHYKMPIKGNWNKKNVNLTYLILKLRSRMTDSAVARAMQCKTAPQAEWIGKNRRKLVFILHKALYSDDYNKNSITLIQDALSEEYQAKKIKLSPVNITINEHNERYRINRINAVKKRKKVKVTIKKDTKFKLLIDNMPENYELIRNEQRLSDEAEKQHNCVYSYADSIRNDNCMIYSTVGRIPFNVTVFILSRTISGQSPS